jgi:UDP-N-acetylmuramyl pentapeptide phosphotransferase/UDP-N-acetylglucosamine-1-phosphate transferase
VARGDHPMRTPFYGGLLIVAAMLAAVAVTAWTHPSTLVRGIVLVVALVAALVGVGLTLRDLTPPRR